MIYRPGQLAGYWPQAADDLAWAEGYPTVSACEQAIARGDTGPCRSGLKGFADYGIAEWHGDRIAAINGKTVLGPDDFLLEDAVFLGAKHLYKTDPSDGAGGVCGLGIEPDDATLIPYRDIAAISVTPSRPDPGGRRTDRDTRLPGVPRCARLAFPRLPPA